MNDKNVKISKGGDPGIVYKLFKGYVRLVHFIYYRKIITSDSSNIPHNCPLLVVSNHQNSLNDALGLVFAIHSRGKKKLRAITRADAFEIPYLGFVMHGIGLLPAFRIEMGVEHLSHNIHAMDEASNELLDNGTVMIYPESGHQDKRWLGKFTYGYLRLVFDAAEKSNFEKEIFILPSCNHYSDYFNEREDILIKFGEPLSIAPYYERYKTKPRTVQRELNEIVRQKVANLMLNIKDLDNYRAIDFLRNTYGKKYAEKNGLHPENLAEKLISDKKLVGEFELLKSNNGEMIQSVYDNALVLEDELKKLKIADEFFDEKISKIGVFGKILLHLLLFPLHLFACISCALIIYPPKIINRKISDKMLYGSIKQAVSILVGIPLTNIAAFVLGLTTTGSLPATLIYMFCLPFLYIFAVNFGKTWKRCIGQARFVNLFGNAVPEKLIDTRTKIHKTLDDLLKLN